MQKNNLKQKLARGETATGVFMPFPSADVVELSGYLGFDFAVIDAEHGPMTTENAAHLLRAAQCSGITPLIAVPENNPHVIMRFLDIGAMGVHVPQVSSAAEAQAIVKAVKYYPQGSRGLARPRSGEYGLLGSMQEYMTQSNNETMVVAQIENVEALVHLREIINVDGIDAFFIGPTDLSQALGIPGQHNAPLAQSTIDTIISQVRDAGKAVGIYEPDPIAARAYIDKGVNYICTGTVALLSRAARTYLKGVRGE